MLTVISNDFLSLGTWEYTDQAFAEPEDTGNDTDWGLNSNWRNLLDAVATVNNRCSSIETEYLSEDYFTTEYWTPLQSTLEGFVPYGEDIDLGEYSIKAQTVQTGDTADEASAALVGTIRYRQAGTESWAEMCMQTEAETYAWVILAHEDWTI